MYLNYLQNQQNNNSGNAEYAGNGGVYPCEGDAEIHPCAEEVENEEEHKAEKSMNKELEYKLHGLFEDFEQQTYERKAHCKGEDYYCDCHFILSPSIDFIFLSVAL